MKTFIASDFHGVNPTNLVRSLYAHGEIERAIFLGDYDEPNVLKKIKDLDIDKLVLVGNHEYEFARKSDEVGFVDPVTKWRYWKIWGDTEAGQFAREGPIKIEEELSGKRIVYLHGSLRSAHVEPQPCEVWGRLVDSGNTGFSNERRIECNFDEMKKNDYWTMFRGHDHFSRTYSANRDEYAGHMGQIRSSVSDVVLKKDDMNIVSVGAFADGDYYVFDESTLKLEFKRVRRNV